MTDRHARIDREGRTVAVMIALYCRHHHGKAGALCAACEELASYARERLTTCPFQEGKTVCSKCSVHCYRPEMRQRVKEVMRYSGPRMMTRHPVMAVQHLLDQHRKAPLEAAKRRDD